MDNVDKDLLKEIADMNETPKGAYNIRKNGQGIERQVTKNVNIVTKKDKPGIDIFVKENTKYEFVHIPVIITESGLTDVVYNDFYIGKNADVVIIAGCGIHNDHHKDSQHDGIHRFLLEERAREKYRKTLWRRLWKRKKNFKSSNRSNIKRRKLYGNGNSSNKRCRLNNKKNKRNTWKRYKFSNIRKNNDTWKTNCNNSI